MKTLNTDKSWIAYGKKNPYYGVVAHDEFLDENLTDSVKLKFFNSGKEYIDDIFKILRNDFIENFKPEQALDFGCGTGRLTIPISAKSKNVTGVDISDDMLNETKLNAQTHGLNNVQLLNSNEFLEKSFREHFDFIHSYIVFQHINLERGEKIFHHLYNALECKGIGAIHLTYANSKSNLERIVNIFRYRVPFFNNFLNILRGKAFNLPLMQMNLYNLNKILLFLQNSGVGKVNIKFTDHGGHYGVILFFQKEGKTENFGAS